MSESKPEKTIAFKVDSDKHMQIKLRATKEGKSLKQFILDLVDAELEKK